MKQITTLAALTIAASTASESATWTRWNELPPELVQRIEGQTAKNEEWTPNMLAKEVLSRHDYGDLISDDGCESCALYRPIVPKSGVVSFAADREKFDECVPRRCRRRSYPEPLAWLLLLREPLRSSVRFQLETAQHDEGLRLNWNAAAGGDDLGRLTAWSGYFVISPRTGAIIELKAEPTFQQATREAERMRYQMAPRVNLFFFGFVAARRPLLRNVSVRFGFHAHGVNWPTFSSYEETQPTTRDSSMARRWEEAHFTDIRFFQVSTTESQGTPN